MILQVPRVRPGHREGPSCDGQQQADQGAGNQDDARPVVRDGGFPRRSRAEAQGPGQAADFHSRQLLETPSRGRCRGAVVQEGRRGDGAAVIDLDLDVAHFPRSRAFDELVHPARAEHVADERRAPVFDQVTAQAGVIR